MYVKNLVKILKEEGELFSKNLFQLMLAVQFKNKELLDQDGDLFLTVDSLIMLNNYITDSHNMQLRQTNVKPAFYNKQSWISLRSSQNYTYLLINLMTDK